MSKTYRKEITQKIPASPEEVWAFISTPRNLNLLTPPDMHFVTLSGDDEAMYPGQIITYRLQPLAGLRVRWITEITHVQPGHYFVDEQRFGPYAFWHHQHFVTAIDGGTEMRDLVHYRMPFGVLGSAAHALLVRQKLDRIFHFRHRKIEALFGKF